MRSCYSNWKEVEICELASALNDCEATALKKMVYIRSFTYHDINNLMGYTPEILALGENLNTSEFAAFKWYEWVKYKD